MRLHPSDPEIETLVSRIRRGDLDLQPDFQRGEVWSEAKKRRLIDTILRDWHVPPIHVIEREKSNTQEVLDGQQRLAAIRDFVDGVIRVDGSIPPSSPEIQAAHDCTYESLPPHLRKRFDRFTIRVFRLVEFKPDEPGELFYRLNQPTGLTAAEQRNAFFGPVREQVRDICRLFEPAGLTSERIGFSNSRMAYDDIIGRLCVFLEKRSLRDRISATAVTERYRDTKEMRGDLLETVRDSVESLGACVTLASHQVRFNKATLFSWLLFLSRLSLSDYSLRENKQSLGEYLVQFERQRSGRTSGHIFSDYPGSPHALPPQLLDIYTDRSSLRVADVTSIILRDAILAYCYARHLNHHLRSNIPGKLITLHSAWERRLSLDGFESQLLLLDLDEIAWGDIT